MTAEIFLSLSFVDEKVVQAVYDRLPRGIARYYRRAFDRGEDLVAAMERNVAETNVFVLFASQASLASYAVAYEVDLIRSQSIFGKQRHVYVFPIEPGIGFSDLPAFLQKFWQPNIGESPADIARFLTTILLEPSRGLSVAAPEVVGRGVTVDTARRLSALHLQKHRANPRVYIFPGISGIGRRTFAAYYLRQGLGAEANLPFGPSIQLSAQAELVDLYRALRSEIDPFIDRTRMARDQEAFQSLDQAAQIDEVILAMGYFGNLHQAVTIVTPAGLFEDDAKPKDWVAPLLSSIPVNLLIVVITNIQFRSEFVDGLRAVSVHSGSYPQDLK